MNKLLYISSFLTLVMSCISIQATATAMPASLALVHNHTPIFKPINSPNNKSIATFKYVRPKTADNGSPFPKKSGYIKGYPIQFKEGYSTLTVNNSKNSSDVFVKLYALDSIPPQPVRVFFIRKGDKFTAVNIKPGSYDIRYRDLNYGGLSRTDNFILEEYQTFEGATKFKRMTLTLYKVPGGNMKIYPISEQEF